MLIAGKPHEVASRDTSRPVLNAVNLRTDSDGSKYLEATDSYILARLPVTEADKDTDGMIPAAAVKLAVSNRINRSLSANSVVTVTARDGATSTFERPDGMFPNVPQLMPESSRETIRVALNAKLLMQLAKAFESDSVTLEIPVDDLGRPMLRAIIGVKPNNGVRGASGLIMPIRPAV